MCGSPTPRAVRWVALGGGAETGNPAVELVSCGPEARRELPRTTLQPSRSRRRSRPQAAQRRSRDVRPSTLNARDEVQRVLAEQGIATAVQYPTPLPLLEAYARFRHRAEDFPVASALTARILSLPLYPELTSSQQDDVVAALSKAVARTKPDLTNV